MDVKNISDEIDLKLNMLSGDSLYADNIEVKQISLRQIRDIGYTTYSKLLSLITLDKKKLLGDESNETTDSLFDIVIKSGEESIINSFADSLCLFLGESKEDLYVSAEHGFVFGLDKADDNIKLVKIINNGNFPDIVQILKYQNCLVVSSEKYVKYNPADEKARKIVERMKKNKEALEKARQSASNEGANNIDFFDIISSVSTKSNTYNKQNIWDLTIYQLYDEYKRLETIVGFETSVLALTQGAKIELKHWSAKIE
jgi:hypothetical protein